LGLKRKTLTMIEQLIQTLKNKGLLSQKDVLLLKALDLNSYPQINAVLVNTEDKKLIYALCRLLGSSRYTSIKLDTEAFIGGLLSLLENEDWEIRQRAVETIGNLDAKTQLQRLSNVALYDVDSEVRAMACDAIGLWREEASIPVLGVIAADNVQPVVVRERAIEALGGTNEKALPILVELLKDQSAAIRFTTLGALHNINDVRAIPYVSSLLTDMTEIEPGLTIAE
jgi:HEAT repeat protein